MPVPDAVLVSASADCDRHGVQGDAPDIDALELGTRAVAEAVRRAGLALRSHQRAVAGIDSGSFGDEIFPLEVSRRDGSTAVVLDVPAP